MTEISGPTWVTRLAFVTVDIGPTRRLNSAVPCRIAVGGWLRSRVELFEAIRRDARREELSIRALADRHGVHRRTVREALRSAVPAPRKPRTAQAPKLDPVRVVIDEILQTDLDAPREQRHTARRIHDRLLAEHGAVGLSYSAARDYVRRRRPEIAAGAGRTRPAAFILQDHAPGAEAEVDFGEV